MSFNQWQSLKVGDVADVLNGYAFKSKDFTNEGIPVIKIKNIVPPSIELSDVQYVSEELFNEKERFALKYNDILISMTGSNVNQIASAVGKIGRVRLKNKKLLLNQRVGKLYVTDSDKCNEDFLYYYLIQDEVRYNLASSASGSANQANINPNQIKNISINLPPIDEQKAIAKILSDLDKKIETNNKINKKLEEMAQAIFKQWFVDFEFTNEDGKPYKSSGGEMVESELGMIPKGWEVKKLSEVISVKDGTHDSPKAKEDGFSLITSKHIKGNKILYNEAKLISKEDFDKINKRSKVDTNDILITMIGTVGNLIIVNKENVDFAIKNIGLIKTSENEEIFEFVYLYLKSKEMKNYIESRLAGSTQQYISLNELRNIPIILPKKEILTKFKKIIKSIFEQITIDIREESNLIHLRDTLLPKLMSGEIRVPID